MRAPQTWHHGLIADWWANFNLDAPEVELYRPYLRSAVLDAGCGAGRLLVPLLAAGYDIDGCDVSADMIDRCRKRAPGATLWVSALHELVPPRRYGSIVASGVFGLGSTRAQDEEAVRRLHDALEPCGTLVLDNEEAPWDCAHATGHTSLRGRRRLMESSSRSGAASTRSTSRTAAFT